MSLDAARWIEPLEEVIPPPGERPGYELRGTFELDHIGQATVCATAHGVYELFLNGTRVGDLELTPGFTAYRKRLQVHEWDVTDLLRPGTNELTALLSDGWFRGRHGFERHADGFGDRVALLVALELAGETVLATGAGWRSRPSRITRADLMDGQGIDFRVEYPWTDAVPVSGGLYDDRARLIAPTGPPVRRIEELLPVAITHPQPGSTVVDFGQNINGWVRLRRLGPAGTTLTLTHGEALAPDGTVTTDNIRAFDFATQTPLPAGQVDVVTSAGRDGDVFEPRHTTHGFQFVQLDGVDTIEPDDIRAIVVHSELEPAGEFTSSDDRLNALHEAVVWSLRGNACDIPTDCPQRERSGFTGDWQIFLPTATRLYDVRRFTEKWLADVEADQWADGRIPTISPDPAGDGPLGNAFPDMAVGSAGWGDAAVIVPWELWRAYGDLGILGRWLPMMRRWVDYEASGVQRFHFGEWLEPGVPPSMDPTIDRSIVSIAFLAYSAGLLSRIGELLDESEVAERYRAISADARARWQQRFIGADGRLTEESQANYTRGLAFGLFDDASAAANRLVELIDAAGGHLGTGFLSTAQLLPVLADHGHAEVAYRLLTQTGIPSWLEMIDRGATTIWEWWDGVDGDQVRGSLNHYSKGAVASFLHTHVAGIRMPEPEAAGYSRVVIAPQPGGGLTSASAWHDSPHGMIRSAWAVEAGRFSLTVDVPVEADILLPDGSRHEVAAGHWAF